jgi:hypothetical protein
LALFIFERKIIIIGTDTIYWICFTNISTKINSVCPYYY